MEVFAMTGLTSRGGLSNWEFFFFPTELVMCDVGMGPALKAGIAAGLRPQGMAGALASAAVGDSATAPGEGEYWALESWCAALERDAKRVVRVRDADIVAVRLNLRALQHQFLLLSSSGEQTKFTLMKRDEALPAVGRLRVRFGARLEVAKTPVYAFFERYAPILMR